MDREAMERAVRSFVEAIGESFDGDDLASTPERVARAWAEDLLSGYGQDPDEALTWTRNLSGSAPVLVRGVSFTSVCVHHLLPFTGRAHVAYLPAERLAGLSKIGRVVDIHARRLQIQERLTREVLECLDRSLRPRGVLVLLEAEHTCMTLRGVRKEGSRLTTLAASGAYEADAAARAEVLGLIFRPEGRQA